jgi:tetratricopeptide (TPR) repeat protein
LNLFHRVIGFTLTLVAFAALTICIPGTASSQTADVQTVYERALELLQNGKTADALGMVTAAIDAGAGDPSLYNLKGLAASELGRNQEAEESFRTLIRLTPKSAMGYNNLGVMFSKLDRPQDAATAFREARALEPQNFTALLGLGTSLTRLHQYAEAITYLQSAWSVRPGDFQAGYELALAMRETKQPAEAKKALNRMLPPAQPELAVKYYSLAGVVAEDLKDTTAASQFYRRAYAINPTSYEIYLALVRSALSARAPGSPEKLPPPPENLSADQEFELGRLLASYDAYEDAIPRFEEVLRRDPSNEAVVLNVALAYKGIGKSDAAMDLIRRTLEQRPSPELYHLLASLDEESGGYVEAAQSYQRAVELDPTNEQYYFDLGMEYLAHFTFGPALEVYQVGSKKFANSSRQYLGLAYSHYALREYKVAADAFTKALEIEPDSPAVFQAWNTVLSFLAPQDWEGLLPRLNRLATDHPQSAELAFAYGAALFHSELAKGERAAFDRPQTFLENAARLRPQLAVVHLELGGLYAARKQNQKAVDEYLQVIRDDPKSDIAHYRLGQVYRGMNKMELATQELARYQELSRLHEEELKRSRSAIQQFVLSQPARPEN